jgi:hypothetical protein
MPSYKFLYLDENKRLIRTRTSHFAEDEDAREYKWLTEESRCSYIEIWRDGRLIYEAKLSGSEEAPPSSSEMKQTHLSSLSSACAERSKQVQRLSAEFNVLIDWLEGEVELATADADLDLPYGIDRTEHDRKLGEARQKKRTELRRESEQRRWSEFLIPLKAYDDAARMALALYPNPEAMLSAHGIGSTERLEAEQALRLIDLDTLAQLVDTAITTGNRMLGVSLLTINGRLPIDRRRFRSQDLAHALMGEEHDQLLANATLVRDTYEACLERNRQFQTASD